MKKTVWAIFITILVAVFLLNTNPIDAYLSYRKHKIERRQLKKEAEELIINLLNQQISSIKYIYNGVHLAKVDTFYRISNYTEEDIRDIAEGYPDSIALLNQMLTRFENNKMNIDKEPVKTDHDSSTRRIIINNKEYESWEDLLKDTTAVNFIWDGLLSDSTVIK